MNPIMTRLLATLFLALLSLTAQGVEVVTYYHNDALGSPIIATDQEGRVVWRKSYAPYGEPIGPEAPNEPGYTGKFEEPDLGIQYFGARWYDPRIGRFLAVDPVGFDPQNPQSFNRYAYANNNPYRYVDPNGESPLDVGFFIVDTVSFGVALYSANPQAIASAGADFAASAVGLASPIPGTGLAIKAARAADKVGDAARVTKALPAPTQVPNAGGHIVSNVTTHDDTFYRVFSGEAQTGRFLTKVPPKGQQQAIEGLALPPGNRAEFIQEVVVPAGTRLQRSRTLPAFGRRGGKEQFELLDQIPNENFGSGRPLQ